MDWWDGLEGWIGWIDWRAPGLEGQIRGMDWSNEIKGWTVQCFCLFFTLIGISTLSCLQNCWDVQTVDELDRW